MSRRHRCLKKRPIYISNPKTNNHNRFLKGKQLIYPTVLHQNYEEIAANCVLPACGCMYEGWRIPTPHGINLDFDILILAQKRCFRCAILSSTTGKKRKEKKRKGKNLFLPHKHHTQRKVFSTKQSEKGSKTLSEPNITARYW